MPRWRTFLIQLLNIAGIGPIFGAIMGACFGPVVFLWITFGGIFVGAMHDYLSGIILLRNDGLSLPEIVGRYLGGGMRQFMRAISLVLLILVGVVFMRSPASILGSMITAIPYWGWIAIILVYYFIATMLPIDKLIGKIYPLFGGALIFMAIGLAVVLFTGDYTIPNTVQKIGARVFKGKLGLTKITIPNTVIEIGEEAFHGCTKITVLEFAEGGTESLGTYGRQQRRRHVPPVLRPPAGLFQSADRQPWDRGHRFVRKLHLPAGRQGLTHLHGPVLRFLTGIRAPAGSAPL